MDRETEIQNIANSIFSLAEINELYLFGSSLNEDKITKDSDIDMLLIGNTNLPIYKRGSNIRKQIKTSYPLDILFFTPEEINQFRSEYEHVANVAIKEGRRLYPG